MRWLKQEVDPRPLAVARIAVAVAAVLNLVEAAAVLDAAARLDARDPALAFLPPVTSTGAVALLLTGVVAALLLALGAFPRPAAITVAVLLLGAGVWDHQAYSNHFTLTGLCAAWLAFSRSDAAWSIRSHVRGRRPVERSHQILLMGQITTCYLFAALVKLNESFLSGAVLDSVLTVKLAPEVLPVLALAAVATELFLAVGLWVRRTRVLALAAGVGLHGSIVVLMMESERLGLLAFGLVCVGLYPLFFAQAQTCGSGPEQGRCPLPVRRAAGTTGFVTGTADRPADLGQASRRP